VRRPGGDAQVDPSIAIVERLIEIVVDEHVLVGPGAPPGPDHLPGGYVQRLDPPTHAQLAAAVAAQHLVLDHRGSHRHRLPDVNVSHLRLPDLLAGFRIDCDGVGVQRVVEDPPVGIGRAAIYDVAAGDSLGG